MIVNDGADISIFFPDELNQCTEVQLELLKKCQLEATSFSEFSVRWFTAGCSAETYADLLESCDSDSLADIACSVTQRFLECKKPLTKTPYEVMYLEKHTLTGPGDFLQRLCFGQFIDSEEQLFLYFSRKETDHLVKLTAVLFRPAFEKEYNAGTSAQLLKDIRKSMTDAQLYVILEFYLGCRAVMARRFKHVFPAPPEGKDEKKAKITPRMILDMVEGYHKKMVQYSPTPSQKMKQYLENAWTVLEFIDYDIESFKAREKELQKQKNAAKSRK
ncbi:hypothetical protein [Jiulongibacter sediminis]|uniref:hypothetical protein n=1 Tax=Jiulongibacter sediminis TaxID=1605367 RepID=UPI0026EB6961|nr:hypothetical protein [Jiulongibacter sediminis]